MLERPRFPLLQIRLAGENVARAFSHGQRNQAGAQSSKPTFSASPKMARDNPCYVDPAGDVS